MADVNLVVRAHLRGERELNKAERKLLRIAVAAKTADNNMASLGASSKKFAKIMNQTTERFTKIMTEWDKLVKGFGVLIVKTLGMATKFMVVEFAAVAASMIVVHGLFKIGRWLMKGYHGAIKMVAGAAAGAAAALSVLSAAIREQQAAMFSYKGLERNYKELRGGVAAVRMEMRGLATDVTLSAMGIENLNTIFAGASQRGTFSRGLTKGLLDIAAAGQPLEEAAKWLGEIVGLLTDPDVNMSEVRKSFEGMGKLGEETWKKLARRGVNTVSEIRAAINSGLVTELAGVGGQWDAVSGTLMGRLKAAFAVVRTDFADIGEAFLGDIKFSFDEMLIIFRRMLFRIRGDLVKFGKGGLLGTMVAAMEKLESGMVKLINKWLPMAEGMFGRIADWWDRFTDGWHKITSSLSPMVDAARTLEKMFGNILRPVGDYLSDSFRQLRIFMVDSKDEFLEHGSAIGRLLDSMLMFQARWTDMFKEAMPFINKLIDGITQLVELFGKMTGGFKAIGNFFGGGGKGGNNPGFGSAFAMMAMVQFGRRNRDEAGTLVETGLDLANLQQMNVTAQQVNINGATGGAAVKGRGGSDLFQLAPSAAHIGADGRPGAAGAAGAAAAAAGARTIGELPNFPKTLQQALHPTTSKPLLFGASDYLKAGRRTPGFIGPPDLRGGIDSGWMPGAPSGTGFPVQNFTQPGLFDEVLKTKPYFNEKTLRWHDPSQGFGAGRMITNAAGMASMGKTLSGADLIDNAQGSLFADHVGSAADLRPFVPSAPGVEDARTQAQLQARAGLGGGMARMLGGAFGGGMTDLDYSQMSAGEIKMMIGAPEFLSTGRQDAYGQDIMEQNPYHGQSVGSSLFQSAFASRGAAGDPDDIDPATGQPRGAKPARKRMPWKGKGGLKSNLKAAWRREKMLQTTRITGSKMLGGARPRLGQRIKTRMARRMGTGSARHTQIQKGLRGFNARMGVGMGMGMLSGMMGEEAQGAMNLGSMVAMVNPLLGMGIGLGGAALKAQTVHGGMASGAGAGAAIGMMVGPGGAVAGAIIGGLVGGMMGALGAGKAKEAEVRALAKTTADQIWAGMISGIDEARAAGGPLTGARMRRAMNVNRSGGILAAGTAANALERKGDYRLDEETRQYRSFEPDRKRGHFARQAVVRDIYANQKDLGVEMSKEDFDKALVRPFEFLEDILPEITKHHGVATTVLDKYTSRMDHMTSRFGVTEDKLLEMANTVGVNLYDATMDTTDMIKKLSGALMQTRDAINNIFQDHMNVAYGELEIEAKKAEASIAMDESAREFKERSDAGELGENDAARFLMDQFGYFIDYAKGDQVAALSMLQSTYGPDTGAMWDEPRGILAGDKYKNEIMTPETIEIMRTLLDPTTLSDMLGGALRQQLIGGLGNVGLEAQAGMLPTEAYMAGLGGGAQMDLDSVFKQVREDWDVASGFMDEEGNLTGVGKATLKGALDEVLGPNSGLGKLTNFIMPDDTKALDSDALVVFAEKFNTSVGTFDTAMKTLIEKLNTGDTGRPIGDVSSRMSQTLAAHDSVSGGLGGKRTITSGYRNYALGSINSDHVTGKALDIVGDNLGSYRRGITSAGGFAEFHGSGDSRHLHTVPAIGDTSMSKGGMGSTSNTNNYTINVTGGPNANAKEVANMVMNEIQNLERSNRERS